MGRYHSPKIVTDGLVLCLDAGNKRSYPGSGTTWTDLSGLGNNGTLVNGVGYDVEKLGVLVFDGVDDYGEIPDIAGVTDFTISNNYCVSFWVNINPIQPNITQIDNAILEKWSGDPAVGYPYVFRYYRSTSQISCGIYNGNSNPGVGCFVETNVWLNVCATFDFTNSQLKLFINGVLKASRVLVITGNIDNSNPLFLGKRGHPSPASRIFCAMKLSNLFIYNRALTEAEVQQNYNAVRGRYGI